MTEKNLSQLLSYNLTEARDKLRTGEINAIELTEAYLQQIEKNDRHLHAYVTITAERARTDANKANELITAARHNKTTNDLPDLIGIPLAIKDLFSTKGIYTTASSKMLADYIPPFESTVTEKLWQAGAVCLGKTHMDEFAMGSSTSTGYHRQLQKIIATINPWSWYQAQTPIDFNQPPKVKLSAGGSSGGSAAAVAGYLALAATGSDTGGSIRQPCSFTGLVGIKPTYGRCSRYGMVAFASSLDQAGVITRSVADAAIMLATIAGHDTKDATCANLPLPKKQWQDAVAIGKKEKLKGLRIAVVGDYDYNYKELPAYLKDKNASTIQFVHAINPQFRDVFAKALAAYYIIAPAEASSNLSRYDGVRFGYRSQNPAIKNLNDLYEWTRQEGFGAEVKRRILIGTYVLSAGYYDAYFNKAQKIRRQIIHEFQKIFEQYDVILLAATPSVAFDVTQQSQDPTEMYQQDLFTIPISMAGLPAGVVPRFELDKQLPLGVQLVTKHFDETTLFQAMAALETENTQNILPTLHGHKKNNL